MAELLLPFGVLRYEEAAGNPYRAINWSTLAVYVCAAAAGLAVLLTAGEIETSVIGGVGPAEPGELVSMVLPLMGAMWSSPDGRLSASVLDVYVENHEACLAMVTESARSELSVVASWRANESAVHVSREWSPDSSNFLFFPFWDTSLAFQRQRDAFPEGSVHALRLSMSIGVGELPPECAGAFPGGENAFFTTLRDEWRMSFPWPDYPAAGFSNVTGALSRCLNESARLLKDAPLEEWGRPLCDGLAANPENIALRQRSTSAASDASTLALALSLALLVARLGMACVSQGAWLLRGGDAEKAAGRSWLTLRSVVRYRVAPADRGNLALPWLAAAFAAGLVAVCATGAVVLSRQESSLVSVEGYSPGLRVGSGGVTRVLSLTAMFGEDVFRSDTREDDAFSYQSRYHVSREACEQMTARMARSTADQASIAHALTFSTDGPSPALSGSAFYVVPLEGEEGSGVVELKAGLGDALAEPSCRSAAELVAVAAARVAGATTVRYDYGAPPAVTAVGVYNGSAIGSNFSFVLSPVPAYAEYGDTPLTREAGRCAGAVWAAAMRRGAPRGACDYLTRSGGDANLYLVERRRAAHSPGAVAALTLSFALAYSGAAAVVLKLVSGVLRSLGGGDEAAEAGADAKPAGPLMSLRNIMTPAAALNYTPSPENLPYRQLNVGGALVAAATVAAAATAFAAFAGDRQRVSSVGAYAEGADANTAISQRFPVEVDVASAVASFVLYPISVPLVNLASCKSILGGVAAGASSSPDVTVSMSSTASPDTSSVHVYASGDFGDVDDSSFVLEGNTAGRDMPDCAEALLWPAVAARVAAGENFSLTLAFVDAERPDRVARASVVRDGGIGREDVPVPASFDGAACRSNAVSVVTGAFGNATAIAAACEGIVRRRSDAEDEEAALLWLSTSEERRGTGAAALLAANIAATVATLATVLLRAWSHLSSRRRAAGGDGARGEIGEPLLDLGGAQRS